MTRDEPTGSDRTVDDLLADYLARRNAGEDVDFDAHCRAHPDHADALRHLKAHLDAVDSAPKRAAGPEGASRSITERIRDQYGDEADLDVELESEGDSEDFASEVLKRLSGREHAFGRYRLKGEVATGGQGAVVRVWDEDLRRNLAMKVMLGQGEAKASGDTPDVDSRALGRFLEEAQVTGQLDHPGIVPVHELGLDSDGRVYFTMKLVRGETLAGVFEKVKTGEDGWSP